MSFVEPLGQLEPDMNKHCKSLLAPKTSMAVTRAKNANINNLKEYALIYKNHPEYDEN